MTSTEMHIEFKVGIDKSDSSFTPNFRDEAIDIWLNTAQQRFIKQRYDVNGQKDSANMTEKRMDDIRSLISTDIEINSVDSTATNVINVREFPLPGNYFLYLTCRAEITRAAPTDEVGTGVYECNTISPQHLDNYLEITGINKPYFRNPVLYAEESDVIQILHDSYSTMSGTDDIELTYIREPLDIEKGVQDSELAEHTHKEIVDIAVNLALENIADPRYQSNIAQNQTQE